MNSNRTINLGKWIDRMALACLVMAFVALLTWVMSMDAETELMEDLHYCSMVRDFEKSNGAVGWPPYRGDEVDCDEILNTGASDE